MELDKIRRGFIKNLHLTDLSGADLRGADLSGANLRGANLHLANLRQANLIGANLSWATLHGANLRQANLRQANLIGADLSGADLSWATLSGANLHQTDLSGANLRGAGLPCTFTVLGIRADGYRHDVCFYNEVIWIRAGCRYFQLARAKHHWTTHARGADCPLCAESLAFCDLAETIANIRKWDVK